MQQCDHIIVVISVYIKNWENNMFISVLFGFE